VGFGRLDNARADWQATRWGERFPALVLSLLVIASGVWPQALVGWSEPATASLALRSGAPAAGLAVAQARNNGAGTLATLIATGVVDAG
jgi:NAD(P)H-quinone oxidoreductase subunit 4